METEKIKKLENFEFKGYEWVSFFPGETIINDLTVMKYRGRIEELLPKKFIPQAYTLHVITSGTMIARINGKEYELKPNDGFFTSPDFFLGSPTSLTYVEMYFFTFSAKFIQEAAFMAPAANIAAIYVHPIWHMSPQKTQRFIQYTELLRGLVDDKNREASIQIFNAILSFLATGYNGRKTNKPLLSRDEEITGRFMNLVDAHCEQHHSLDWYASEMCLSTRYVANTVKAVMGFTASECIENALIQRAKSLLLTTTKPVQQIADQLGFQNQSHFGTFFKRHEGVSPAAFRKQQ